MLDKEGFYDPLVNPIQSAFPPCRTYNRNSALWNPIDCVAGIALKQIALMK